MKPMKTPVIAAAVLLASTSAMALRPPQTDVHSRTAVTVIDRVLDRDARDQKELDKRDRKAAKRLEKQERQRAKEMRKAEHDRRKDARR